MEGELGYTESARKKIGQNPFLLIVRFLLVKDYLVRAFLSRKKSEFAEEDATTYFQKEKKETFLAYIPDLKTS